MFWLDAGMAEDMRSGKLKSRDSVFIGDMIIPLTPPEAEARARKFGVDDAMATQIGSQPPGGHWTCRHWDEETRLCTVYDQRPDMCRWYPYGKGCSHGCDYEITDPEQIARYATEWNWKAWRWSRDRYHLRPGKPPYQGDPGEGWIWDATARTMQPVWEGWTWDHKKRVWYQA